MRPSSTARSTGGDCQHRGGFEPLATRAGGRRVVGSTPGEAMGFVIGAADLGAAGGAGLAGVTEAMARAHKVTLTEAFDACTNLKIAGAKLAKLLADAGDGPAVMSAERRAVQLYFGVKSERPKWDVFGASGAARAANQKGKS
jgi:hypothetical protein